MATKDKLQPALGFEEILNLDENAPPISPLTANKPYHEIEEFLNLTWEELFLEPVYVEEEEEEEVAFGEEGFVESEFLDLAFEALFNIPVRLTRLDMNDSEDAAAGKVQSDGTQLAKLKRGLSQNGIAETQTSDRGDIDLPPLSDITITTSEFLPPPTDIPTNTAPFAPLFYLGALQERTGQVQTIVDNIFRLPSSLGANLYDSLIPHGGDGSPNITLFLRPDSSQTKTTVQGSSKITITTVAGNTFEFYTANEGQYKFGDYIYTLKNPIFHGDSPSNIPHEFEEDDGNILVIDSDRNNKPTVEEITNILKQGFSNGTYPNSQDLRDENSNHGDDHNPLVDNIDDIFLSEDEDDTNTYWEVFVYDVVDSADGDRVRGYIVIKIIDDKPVLANNSISVNETLLFVNGSANVNINILNNDDKGFDNGKIIEVLGIRDNQAGDLNPAANVIRVDTLYGEFQVNTITGVGKYFLQDATAVPDALGNVNDTILYIFEDSDGDTASAQLTVKINLNQAPVAEDDFYTINENTTLTENTLGAGLLGNDNDPDNQGSVIDRKIVVAIDGDTTDVGTEITLSRTIALENQEIGNTINVNPLLKVNSDGTFTFKTNNQFDALAQGESTVISFDYTMADAEGLADTAQVDIKINGVNDAPVAVNMANSVNENNTLSDIFFDADDIDTDDNQASLTYNIISNLGAGEGVITVNGNKFSFDPGNDFQSLAQGESKVVDFTYQTDDGHGFNNLSNVATVSITVTGVNDAVSVVDSNGAVEEDVTLSATGSIDAQDIDTNDINTLKVSSNQTNDEGTITDASNGNINIDGKYGIWTINAKGEWTYDLDNASIEVQSLAEGEIVFDELTAEYSDAFTSANATISITITGTNDNPTTKNASGLVTEDSPGLVNFDIKATDIDTTDINSLFIKSVQTGDSKTILDTNPGTISILGKYGTLQSNAQGQGTYTSSNALLAMQALAVDEVATDRFNTQYSDGMATDFGNITITVIGVNDAPIAQDMQFNVQENVVALNDFDADDVDSDDDQSTLQYAIVSDLDPGEGKVTVNGNSFDYDPLQDFNYLAEGETANVSFTYQANDGNALDNLSNVATVTITVEGVNDAPTIENDSGNVKEDFTFKATGSIQAQDVDTNDLNTLTVTSNETGDSDSILDTDNGNIVVQGKYGLFTINALGEWEYDLDNNNINIQSLAEGQLIFETFSAQYSDASTNDTSTITIFIEGTNDAPMVSDSAGMLTEDSVLVSNGTVFAFDIDTNDLNKLTVQSQQTLNSSTIFDNTGSTASVMGLYGILFMDTFGNWEYQLNNNSPQVQALVTGQTVSDNFSVVYSDNITSDNATIQINIQGANELPPVVLDLNGDNQVPLIRAQDSNVVLMMNGIAQSVGWIDPNDGFLLYDKDGSGGFSAIEEIAFTHYSPDARTDLEGLRLAFDSNHDNIFDAQDTLFAKFGVWQDKNTNGITDPGEFASLIEHGIVSIYLQSSEQSKDLGGNYIHGVSDYTLANGETAKVFDVSLEYVTLQESDVLQSENNNLSVLLGEQPENTVPMDTTPSPTPEISTSFQAMDDLIQANSYQDA